ncbi:MAG: TauD/TfdA family dioxygenase [Proteobacteria bacterium]|nr:TauD/TfdA family dioxygenase [Pseudomonadota bacterium]
MEFDIIDVGGAKRSSELNLVSLMRERSALVVRNCRLDEYALMSVAESLGQPLEYKVEASNRMFGKGPITYLEGSQNEAMSLGRDMMPLHNDGVVFKQQIDFLLLYCSELSQEYPGGDTIICDQRSALDDLEADLMSTLMTVKVEYLLVNKWFHDLVDKSEEWVETSPIILDDKGHAFLTVELPYPEGVVPGWKVRIQGWGEDESAAFLDRLARHFNREAYCYTHEWQKDDLLVLKNRETLHGRSKLEPHGVRHLMRCHIKAMP